MFTKLKRIKLRLNALLGVVGIIAIERLRREWRLRNIKTIDSGLLFKFQNLIQCKRINMTIIIGTIRRSADDRSVFSRN